MSRIAKKSAIVACHISSFFTLPPLYQMLRQHWRCPQFLACRPPLPRARGPPAFLLLPDFFVRKHDRKKLVCQETLSNSHCLAWLWVLLRQALSASKHVPARACSQLSEDTEQQVFPRSRCGVANSLRNSTPASWRHACALPLMPNLPRHETL